MRHDKDADFGVAVRAALCLSTCDVDFWRLVERRETEDMPAIALPWWARYVALGALVVAVWGHGWLRGAAHADARHEALRMQAESATLAHAAELARRADEITLVYLTQTRTVRERGQAIVREVSRYVTRESDAACPTDGLIGLLNAAARNELPSAAGSPDAAAAGPAANP